MYRTAAALKTFFSGFGLPAYAADSVPDDVELPYITYSMSVPEWNQKASLFAQVWDRRIPDHLAGVSADPDHGGRRLPVRIYQSFD